MFASNLFIRIVCLLGSEQRPEPYYHPCPPYNTLAAVRGPMELLTILKASGPEHPHFSGRGGKDQEGRAA